MAQSFDDELRRAFDALGGRLRDELSGALAATANDLLAAATADRDRMAADLTSAAAEQARLAAESARAEAERAAGAHLASSIAAAQDRARRAADADAAQRTRSEVEAALAAARASARPDGSATIRLLDAIRTLDDARSLTDVLTLLVDRAAGESGRAALLVLRGGRMRGWRAAGLDPRIDVTSIDLPVAGASFLGNAVRSRATVSSDGSDSGSLFGEVAAGERAIAVPVLLAGDAVAVVYADASGAGTEPPPSWDAAVEVLARHAARRLEALTAFMAARALLGSTEAAARVDNTAGAGPAAAVVDDEAAQRYARLLVSEIKLYHEAEVAAGREHRDLGSRLGGEIARARSLYDQRVPPPVRARSDYFGVELVRTLAAGDATALGSPGT